MIYELNITNPEADNYFEAFGIEKDRAQELINKSIAAIVLGENQSRAMCIASVEAKDHIELAFIMFKIGEMYGVMACNQYPQVVDQLKEAFERIEKQL